MRKRHVNPFRHSISVSLLLLASSVQALAQDRIAIDLRDDGFDHEIVRDHLESGVLYKFVLTKRAMLVISTTKEKQPDHRALAADKLVDTGGYISFDRHRFGMSKVVLNNRSAEFCPAVKSLDPLAQTLAQRFGREFPVEVVDNPNPKCEHPQHPSHPELAQEKMLTWFKTPFSRTWAHKERYTLDACAARYPVRTPIVDKRQLELAVTGCTWQKQSEVATLVEQLARLGSYLQFARVPGRYVLKDDDDELRPRTHCGILLTNAQGCTILQAASEVGDD